MNFGAKIALISAGFSFLMALLIHILAPHDVGGVMILCTLTVVNYINFSKNYREKQKHD